MGKIKNRSKQAMVLGCLSVACLSLIIILFSIYSMNKVREESDFISQKMLPGKIFSMEVLSSIINQETGIRAYIISGNKVFLEPYYLKTKEMEKYYDSLNNLKEIGLNNNTINRLEGQREYIQNFFYQQILLLDSGESQQAKLNLNKGKKLVDEFRIIDNTILNEINSNIDSSRSEVAKTQRVHKYLLFFLGLILTICNFIFIGTIWKNMHKQISRKNKINKE